VKIRHWLFIVIGLLTASSAHAQQQRRISGRVTAQEGGAALTSASVTLVGTTTGTYTNETGQFSILVPSTPVTLRVRRIGYQQKSVLVAAGQSDVSVSLAKDVLQLEAQVVTGTSTTRAIRRTAASISSAGVSSPSS